jgi:hypothetical protein
MLLITIYLLRRIKCICFSDTATTASVRQPSISSCFDINIINCCHSYNRLPDDDPYIYEQRNRRKIIVRTILGFMTCTVLLLLITIIFSFSKKQQSQLLVTSTIPINDATALSTEEPRCK